MGISYNSAIKISYGQTLTLGRPDTRSAAAAAEEDAAPLVYMKAASGLQALVQNAGLQVQELGALEELATRPQRSGPTCLVLHLAASTPDNVALVDELLDLPATVPFICIAEDIDLATVVSVMKAGALDVLRMPVADASLLDAIRQALQRGASVLAQVCQMQELKDRYEALSQRERQVMTLLASGLLNKQVGGKLGISEITVKAHRGRVMNKMQANSFASLVKMATTLAI